MEGIANPHMAIIRQDADAGLGWEDTLVKLRFRFPDLMFRPRAVYIAHFTHLKDPQAGTMALRQRAEAAEQSFRQRAATLDADAHATLEKSKALLAKAEAVLEGATDGAL